MDRIKNGADIGSAAIQIIDWGDGPMPTLDDATVSADAKLAMAQVASIVRRYEERTR